MTDLIVNGIVWGVIFWAIKKLCDAYGGGETTGDYVQTAQRNNINDDFVGFTGSTYIETETTNPATGLTMHGGYDAGGHSYGSSEF